MEIRSWVLSKMTLATKHTNTDENMTVDEGRRRIKMIKNLLSDDM